MMSLVEGMHWASQAVVVDEPGCFVQGLSRDLHVLQCCFQVSPCLCHSSILSPLDVAPLSPVDSKTIILQQQSYNNNYQTTTIKKQQQQSSNNNKQTRNQSNNNQRPTKQEHPKQRSNNNHHHNNHHNHHHQAQTGFCVAFGFVFGGPMMADPGGRPLVSGVARRRRERRLRSMLRHKRMTVAMALTEKMHHSSRGQTNARAGEWGHEQNISAKIRKPPTPQPELFSLERGGARPAPLSEVAGWQERVQRHCVEHLSDICPFVQIVDADAPVPIGQCAEIWNLEEDIVDAARLLDRQFAEQIIEVPTISCSPCPSRVPISEPQTAEQLPCSSKLLSRPLTFQFRMVVVVVVFKVLSQDRVQQWMVVSRALTSPLSEASTVFSQFFWRSLRFSPRSGLHSFILWVCG